MRKSISKNAKRCCSFEKQRLVEELDLCELNEKTAGVKHRCVRQAARESGMRARSCLLV